MVRDTQCELILVVDDNVDIRGLAKRLLEKAGYAVLTAADGEEGLRCYEKHQSDIALLLTGVIMPRTKGFELADRVLSMDSQIPILFMSGQAWGAYRGLKCVTKPILPAELVGLVDQALKVYTLSDRAAASQLDENDSSLARKQTSVLQCYRGAAVKDQVYEA
jgi:CheY-like chemotaxis protein